MDDYFVPVAIVAERLGVSSDTVSRWCRQGRIPGIKPGRDWRVPASVAEDLLAGRPARHWGADLGPQLERLRPSDHVLVLVPGGLREARAFIDVLRQIESHRAVTAPEPPPPPTGGMLSRAALAAGSRAVTAHEVQLARHQPAAGSKWLIRWVSRLGPESLEVERRVAEAAQAQGWVVFCVLPLQGDPDLARLVAAHTHVLVGQAHGRSWLGGRRGEAPLPAGLL